MSYITDLKSAPFDIFNANVTNVAGGLYNGYTGTGLNSIPDYGLDALLGSKWATSDGRVLSLVSNAAVALVPGVLVQSSAEVTAHEKLTVAAAAVVGATTVTLTNGATVANLNQYAGGYLIIASGSSILGQTLKIATSSATAASGTITLTLEDPVQIALTVSCTGTLIANPFRNVIINPTTATASPVGVTIYPIPASTAATFSATTGAQTAAGTPQYAFVVSNGRVGCLIDNTVTNVGYPIGRSAATAGAVGVATLTTVAQIGLSAQTQTSAQTGLIFVSL